MRVCLLIVSALAFNTANGQPLEASDNVPCDPLGIRNYEVGIKVLESNYDEVRLTLYNDQGVAIVPLEVTGQNHPTDQEYVSIPLQAPFCNAFLNFQDFNRTDNNGAIVIRYYTNPPYSGPDLMATYTAKFEWIINDANPTTNDIYLTSYLFFGDGNDSTTCSHDDPNAPRSFICPNASFLTGNSDYFIGIEDDGLVISPNSMWLDPPATYHTIQETISGDDWVWPYQASTMCAGGRCDPGDWTHQSPYLIMPVDDVVIVGQPFTKRITGQAPMALAANHIYDWTEDWLTLEFEPGAQLTTGANTTFAATGMGFVASSPQGWRGILFGGGSAVLDGTRVEGVSFAGAHYKRPPSAVTVTAGGSLTLTGGASVAGTINGQGVEAVGEGATVIIEDEAEIFENDMAGVAAHGGAEVTIRDGAQVTENGAGVVASGAGTHVRLGVATVNGNDGPGVTATDLAVVTTTVTGTPSAFLSVSGNRGGLAAEAAGEIIAGRCPATGCVVSEHRYRNNSPNGVYFDALSITGAKIRAQGNDWGVQDIVCLDTEQDSTSTLNVTPIRPSGPACNPPSSERGGGATALARQAGAPAERGMSEAVLARVEAAEDALADGDAVSAVAGMRAALAMATTDDDREGAFAGAARMLMRADFAGVTAALDSATATAARPWGLAALASSHAAQGRAALADATAATLISESPPAGLAARALGVRTRLAAEAGDEASALVHLAALYGVSPESTTFVTAAAVVAASFPEADLPGALRAPLPVGEVAAKTGEPDTGMAAVQVRPNPTTGRATVTVALGSAATLDVTVYDVLGRRVLALADGAAAEGAFAAEVDVSAWPAGVYVVRAVTRGADGSVVVQVARLTVAR